MENIYADIARRTGGNIYIGVVGPVRTGKSTLIKRIMETLVIPNISDPYRRERARDELPQSGSGRTIMTSEPKFVPEDAVEISPDGVSQLRVRMIDSVGYMVNGAIGASEDGQPRLVATPWYDYDIPMTEAAELGTRKVMDEHCSIGLVVTTDGTITDIDRQDYIEAETRAIRDMQATRKPFLVIVNSAAPNADPAQQVCRHLEKNFGVQPIAVDCQALEETDIVHLLQQLLYAFPMQELHVYMPKWIDALEDDHPIKSTIYKTLLDCSQKIEQLGQAQIHMQPIGKLEQIQDFSVNQIDLSSGTISCTLIFPEALFYQILSSKVGMEIPDDGQLIRILTELVETKQRYNKISDALTSVAATGYGIVMPDGQDMSLQPPEIIKKGNTYGVKLKAEAPSIHMIRIDVDAQINPMVGSEQQSKELIDRLSGETTEDLWQSNIFGKSVYDLVQESLNAKLHSTPEDVRSKFRGTLTRIVNDGATGLICIII